MKKINFIWHKESCIDGSDHYILDVKLNDKIIYNMMVKDNQNLNSLATYRYYVYKKDTYNKNDYHRSSAGLKYYYKKVTVFGEDKNISKHFSKGLTGFNGECSNTLDDIKQYCENYIISEFEHKYTKILEKYNKIKEINDLLSEYQKEKENNIDEEELDR